MTRNASGESTIYQDDDGRWHGYVSMGLKDNGRRDRRHVSGQRRADVVRKVRALETQREAGSAAAAGRVPILAGWLEHWLETIAVRRVRPSTLARYRGLARNQLIPKLGHHRLDRLAPEHVEAAYAELLACGLAPASVLQAHRVLSRALKVAVQRGKVARNVCLLVDAPSVRREEVEPLTATEARAVLEAAKTERNAARWSVALALGLRQGEALGLAWDDVEFDAGTLHIRRALQRRSWEHACPDPVRCARGARKCPQRRGGGLAFVEPKSRAGRRTLKIPTPLIDALRAHRAAQLAERLAAGSLWENSGLVFTQANGRPIDPRADHRAWQALLNRAGVRPARLHDARHTAATLLLQQGVAARVAMQILGHSQIGLTLGTYSHVVPELAEEAAERIGAVLWS